MKAYLLAVIIGLLLVMSGCATTPAPEVKIITTETLQVIEPDPQYLADCQVAAPPSIDEYMTLGGDATTATVAALVARLYAREDALTRIIIEQYGYARACSDDKKHLRQLIESQKAIVAKHNAEIKADAEATKAALEKGK